jgi:hypothetical protein
MDFNHNDDEVKKKACRNNESRTQLKSLVGFRIKSA